MPGFLYRYSTYITFEIIVVFPAVTDCNNIKIIEILCRLQYFGVTKFACVANLDPLHLLTTPISSVRYSLQHSHHFNASSIKAVAS